MVSRAGLAMRHAGRSSLLLCGSVLAGVLATSLPAQSVAPQVALVLDQQALRTPARLVSADSLDPADPVSLGANAMRRSVAANLDQRAADPAVESDAQVFQLARSTLFIDARSNLILDIESKVGGAVTGDEAAAASLDQQPWQVLHGGPLSFSTPLYSEQGLTDSDSERRPQPFLVVTLKVR